MLQQYSNIPFEIFTVDDIFCNHEIQIFKDMIETADESNRRFTYSPFKNGKVIDPKIASLMFDRLKPHLPNIYIDRQSTRWSFYGVPKFIMYAKICKDQHFGIHTDTGCEYEN